MRASVVNFLGVIVTLVFCSTCAAGRSATPTAPPAGASPSDIQVAVASNEFTPGAPRVPFVLFDGAKPVADAQAIQVSAFDLGSATPSPTWSGAATSYSDYEIPYWVAYPQLPHAGAWGLGLTITRANGQTTLSQFTLQVVDKVDSPNIGQVPPASQNRTLATEPDIHKLSSGTDPVPALYQMTVADAIKSGKPSVVVFATPAFCTSRLCAPVVHSVEAVYRAHPDTANYIHLEVYKSFDPLIVSDEMEAWHLTSEPWIFVLDQGGKVVARLAGPVSPRELIEALTPLISK